MLLPFIISSLFGDGLSSVEEEAGVPQDEGPPTVDAFSPGSPVVLLWVVGVAAVLNMGVWWLALKRGKALKDALLRRKGTQSVLEASKVVGGTT